jgi:PII-like signaling protein
VANDAEHSLLRVFISECDRWEGRPLYEALVRAAREAGLAGATVLRGVEGYGIHSRIHTVKVAHLADNLPLIVEIIDQSAAIRRFLPTVDAMVAEGLVTLESVNVVIYRSRTAAAAAVASADDEELELDYSDVNAAAAVSGNFSQATDGSRRIIEQAKAEAIAAHRGFVDSVDILLAMLRDEQNVAASILQGFDVSTQTVEQRLREQVSRETPTDQFIKRMEERSRSEARWLGDDCLGTEHLLLALCEIRPSAATDVLMQMGIQPREVCRQVLTGLGHVENWQRWLAHHPDM